MTKAWVTGWDGKVARPGVKLDAHDRVTIPAGQFAKLLIHETIEVPEDAVGLISIKSGIKMRGLVNLSGFHVDPGFRGKLLFAVFNAGTSDIILEQMEPTFLIWYVSLDQPTSVTYSGSRQNVERIKPED